jgi:hypothetical protein
MYEVLSEVLHILEWRLKYVMSHDDKLILHMKKVAEGRAKGIIEGFSILETTEFKEELKKWLGER